MRCDYILFTHLPAKHWKHLEDNAGDLVQVLAGDPSGMLVIFNDEGWLSLLNTVGADFDPVKMGKEFQRIRDLEERLKALIGKFPSAKEDDLSRLRLITAADLYPIVNNLRGNKPGNEASRLRQFLVSDEHGVFYDTAKVVEALVRIRHVGSGLPVIRIDWDALLNNKTLKEYLKGSLHSVIDYCEDYAKEPLIHSSMLSGGYALPSRDPNEWNLTDYNVAYATRIFPALIPSKAAVEQLNLRVSKKDNPVEFVDCDLVDRFDDSEVKGIQRGKKFKKATIQNLEEWGMFDLTVVKSFYGGSNRENWTGIAELGAHPLDSVISGSLLVLSDGAILDLPPFSNFRRNVMWIDDHLKYLLHQSLGHFRRLELNVGTESRPRMFKARIDEAKVHKDRVRAGQGNLRPYTFGVYIPTLFWGSIVDAWIQPTTQLKPPVISELKPDAGPFARYLGRALRRGSFPGEERDALRNALFDEAIRRAERVRTEWEGLCGDRGKSFAARWVSGDRDDVRDVLHKEMANQQDFHWIGWGLLNLKSATSKIKSLDDMSVMVQKGIRVLAEDAITYIDWALEWPSFVRSVRAVRSGSLTLDASFEPTNPTD